MRPIQSLSLIVSVAACLMVPAAGMAISDDIEDQNSIVEWYTGGDRFYLYDDSDTELVNFSEARDVRICTATRRHDITLQVNHDGSKSIVRSGNCLTVDAKKITVSPAEQLPPYVELMGTVESR